MVKERRYLVYHHFIFLNKKVKNNPKTLLEYQEPDIVKKHTYALRTNRSDSTTILDNKSVKQNRVVANYANKHHFSVWDKTIIQKGLNKLPFYHFNNIKRYFPSVKSMDTFITDPKYLGGITVEVTGLQKDTNNLSAQQKLEIVISVATKVANEIATKFGDYRGTKSFYREPLRKYFKNKKLSFSVNTNTTAETGKPTMRNDIPQEYFVDLNKADWYAYNENYGIVVAEALARGIPVLTTKGAPWNELVTNKCGFWVDNTEQGIKEGLLQMLSCTKARDGQVQTSPWLKKASTNPSTHLLTNSFS